MFLLYYIFFIFFGIVHLVGNKAELTLLDSPSVPQTKSLIIDTDAGSDDGVAILNVLGAEELFHEVEVRLITAVHGNTRVDNVGNNVLKILKTAQRLDIPVYLGANESILISPEVENFFGEDGFGDFYFPDPPSKNLLQKEHAVNALIEAVSSNPGELTLLCLGPLTNIALAIKLYPDFLVNLKEIFILGGSDSGVGNVKPGVEFNFYVDPEAASILFKESEKKGKILNVLTWETASIRTLIDMEWRKNVLGDIQSPQISLINNAEKLSLTGNIWISSDALLSSAVIDKETIKSYEEYHADVEVCGEHSRAALFVDYSQTLPKNIRIIKEINADIFKNMVIQNLNPQSGKTNGAAQIY